MRLDSIVRSLCVLLLVSAAAQAGESGKIAGKAADARTKEPLLGVNITVVGTKQGATSDVQGDYFIANVPAECSEKPT